MAAFHHFFWTNDENINMPEYHHEDWFSPNVLPLYRLPHLDPRCITCGTTKQLVPCPHCGLVFACKQHVGPEVRASHRPACASFKVAEYELLSVEDQFCALTGDMHPRTSLFFDLEWEDWVQDNPQDEESLYLQMSACAYWRMEYQKALLATKSGPAVKHALEDNFRAYRQGLAESIPDRHMFLWLFSRDDSDNTCYAYILSRVVLFKHMDNPGHAVFPGQHRQLGERRVFRYVSTEPYDFLAEPWPILVAARRVSLVEKRHDLLFLQMILKLRSAARVRNMQAAYQLLNKGLPLELVIQIQKDLAPDLVEGGSPEFRSSVRHGEDLTKYVRILEGQARTLVQILFEHPRPRYFWASLFIPSLRALGREDMIISRTYHHVLSQVPQAADFIREACAAKWPWFEAALGGEFPDLPDVTGVVGNISKHLDEGFVREQALLDESSQPRRRRSCSLDYVPRGIWQDETIDSKYGVDEADKVITGRSFG